uniref:UBA domain-containing protein n=1 Tax=Anopheles dirus TaxID=7168 RepID=A0A182NMR9_9DIPT
MSHSPPNYMDGVPVKISERFKPPPKIVLPQGVVNRLSQYDVAQVLNDSCYGGELEDTVLKRITEWKAIKERERSDRKSRLQVKEQERVRLIEAEQKRKLNQISYPNTDELSSASDDNDADCNVRGGRVANGTDDEYEEENDESAPSGSSDERTNVKPFDHMSQLSSILVPTVIRDAVPSAVDAPGFPNILDKASTIIPKTTQTETTIPVNAMFGSNNNNNNNNYNKINYSDFENDTSSPFDNMELRTINDLDILAQVLKQNTALTSPANEGDTGQKLCSQELSEAAETKQSTLSQPLVQSEQGELQQHPQTLQTPSSLAGHPYSAAYAPNQQYSMYPTQYQQPAQTTIASSGVRDYLPTSYSTYQPYSNYGTQYDNTAMAASCYSPANTADNRYGITNYTSQAYHVPPGSQTHQPAYPPVVSPNYGYGYQQQHPFVTAPSTSTGSGTGTSTYAPNYGYNTITASTDKGTGGGGYGTMLSAGNYSNYQPVSSTTIAAASAHPSIYTTATVATVSTFAAMPDAMMGLKSKSRSVPDIMRQLDDEVQDSATRRTRNNSQTITDRHTTANDQEAVGVSSNREAGAIDYTKYNQLSHADQNVVKRISSMGFPLERVVWVLQRIGNDDKKIIEHLIPLSELLDLGFEGEKISDALLKFGNNKHKALDYLISSKRRNFIISAIRCVAACNINQPLSSRITKSPPCNSICRSLPEKSTIGSNGTIVDSRM